jgi:CRISPR-associated protein Csb1
MMSAEPLTYERLRQAVAGNAVAIRTRTKLQPAAGEGTKVFPPTHAGGVYATEQRRLAVEGKPGETRVVDCVLLDSVQSQANRIEDALQAAIDNKQLAIPLIRVDFTASELPKQIDAPITSLTVPHRLADAILRDSEVNDGVLFKDSEHARQWSRASLANATPIWNLCPTALVLGMWGSPERAGVGNKFARALVSEIVGIEVVYGVRTGSRIDPLGIVSSVQVVNEDKGNWRFANANEKGAVNPSDIGHSNIPPSFAKYDFSNYKGERPPNVLRRQTAGFRLDGKTLDGHASVSLRADYAGNETANDKDIAAGGVTVKYAEHTAVLSLPQLRRLRFPIDKLPEGKTQTDVDNAARTVLASLALVGLTLSLERGCDLRSRCLLFPDGPVSFELLETPGKPKPISLSSTDATAICKSAIDEATKSGLLWNTAPIVLKPSAKLLRLVRESQERGGAE